MVQSVFHDVSAPVLNVLTALLAGPFPGRAELRLQRAGLEERRITVNGSFEFVVRGDALKASVKGRVPVEASVVDCDGVPVHLLLHVLGGLVNDLKIFREDSGPVLSVINVNDLDVIVY
jgi:Domain of unknown function (DUF6984)